MVRELWISGCFLLASCLLAQQPAPRVGVGITERRLTLSEVVQLAVRNNLEVEIERLAAPSAQAAVQEARGFYDPKFIWAPSYRKAVTPTASALAAADGRMLERAHSENFSFRLPLPWQGLTLGADWSTARLSSNNPFTSLNPYVNSSLNLNFSLPLWRNRAIDSPRAEILVRRRNLEISDLDFELKLIDVVTRAEIAYWNLAAARQNEQVKRDGVALGREQLGRAERMIASGMLAPVELAAAQAELERRLDDWHSSVRALTEAENALKTLIASGREDTIWSDILVPSESLQTLAADEDLKTAVDTAIARRRELKALRLREDQNQVQKELAENQTKPRIDFVAAYAGSGLGGQVLSTSNPFAESNRVLVENLNKLLIAAGLEPIHAPQFGGVPQAFVGGVGTALSSALAGDYRTYQVGLSFDLNLRNRAAEARLTQAAINERRLKLQRAQAEQLIEAQVRNALQALASARQRIAAAEAAERAAQEKLESEIRLFQTGESTNFMVLTRQNEYLDSRYRRVAAVLEYNKAVVLLEQATGTTLEARQLSVR